MGLQNVGKDTYNCPMGIRHGLLPEFMAPNVETHLFFKTQGVLSQAQFLVQAPDPPAFTIPGSDIFVADWNFHDQLEDQKNTQSTTD